MSVSNVEKIKLFACKNYLGHKLLPHKLEVREMLAYKFNMPPTAARRRGRREREKRATGMRNQKNTFKCARRCRKKVNTFYIRSTSPSTHTYTRAYLRARHIYVIQQFYLLNVQRKKRQQQSAYILLYFQVIVIVAVATISHTHLNINQAHDKGKKELMHETLAK